LQERQRAERLLPEGEQGLPARRTAAEVPASASETTGARVPAPTGADHAGEGEQASAVPVETSCPDCGASTYHGDNYCENCGRDLTGRRKGPQVRPISYRYRWADYALLVSAAGSAGGLLPRWWPGMRGAIGAIGAVAGTWCVVRILRSKGELKGLGAAVGAMLLGLLWFVLFTLPWERILPGAGH